MGIYRTLGHREMAVPEMEKQKGVTPLVKTAL